MGTPWNLKLDLVPACLIEYLLFASIWIHSRPSEAPQWMGLNTVRSDSFSLWAKQKKNKWKKKTWILCLCYTVWIDKLCCAYCILTISAGGFQSIQSVTDLVDAATIEPKFQAGGSQQGHPCSTFCLVHQQLAKLGIVYGLLKTLSTTYTESNFTNTLSPAPLAITPIGPCPVKVMQQVLFSSKIIT